MNIRLNKKIILIVSIIILTILLVLFFVFRKPNIKINTIYVEKSTSEKLSEAFYNKEISADQYVLYSAYSIFETNKLDKKYVTNGINHAPNLMNLLNTYKDELSESTKEYVYSKIRRDDIKLGKSKNEISYNNVVPMSYKIADEEYYENTLDKYIVSNNKNFVIWYTNTNSKSKITDEQAKDIASKLEEYVSKYKEMFGFDFKWEPSYFAGMDEEKYKEYISKIAPNDVESVSKALPVFISTVNRNIDGNENTLAFAYYTSMEPGGTYETKSFDEFKGIPVGPYINIDYSLLDKYNFNVDTIYNTVAHELFHHYQNYICGNGTYKFCSKNTSGEEGFIMETSAEWASKEITNINDKANDISSYLNNSFKKIDTIWPYSTYTFLMNYETTVENGKEKILNALRDHGGNTLKYLNDQTDKMDVVMKNLAKNNLINNYEYEGFKGYGDYNFSLIKSDDIQSILTKQQNLEEMAIKYSYMIKNGDKYKISNLNNNDKVYLTIFTTPISNIKKEEIEILSKKKEAQSFSDLKVIYSDKLENNTIVDLKDYKDNFVIFALSNGSLDNKLDYSFEKTNENATAELKVQEKEEIKNGSSNTSASSNNSPSSDKTYNIYLDDKEIDLPNFEVNNRAYVDINKFCEESKICETAYLDNKLDKIEVKSTFNVKSNKFIYTLINEKSTKKFDSTLSVGKTNYDLSQLDVDSTSCPTGKDGNGNEIPECSETSYYVPIRFITQALGYEINWDSSKPNRIDITNNLQDKLEEKLNLKFVFSKDKIDIDKEVTNIIEVNDNVNLDLNQKYYLYTVDKDNIRKYNSAISVLSNANNVTISNEKENDNMTYSSIEIKDKNGISLGLVSTIKIENENSKSGIYPYFKVVGVE